MKSLDMQKLVLSKFQSGDGPTKIFNDLNRIIGLSTVKRWCKMITETGSINLFKSPGRPRSARTKAAINKVKQQLQRKKNVSTRKLSKKLGLPRTSVQRILKDDLKCHPYKKIIEPALTDEHITKRMKFANWIRTNFKKEKTMKILFSDEKMFDIDGVYNSQNDRIWAVDRVTANNNGGIKKKQKFSQKVMVWMGVCSKGLTPLVIFDKGTVDHARYMLYQRSASCCAEVWK
jgi:transposase